MALRVRALCSETDEPSKRCQNCVQCSKLCSVSDRNYQSGFMATETNQASARQDPFARLSERAKRTADPPISYLMHKASANPELISMAVGFVDHDSLPVDQTLASVSDLLSDARMARQALQYGTTQGLPLLRELVVEHMANLEGCSASELGLDVDRVVITTGSQQFLQLVSDVLIDPGDIVLTGAPDYFVYTATLAALGARIIGVSMDGDGLVPEALDDTLARLRQSGELGRVKLLYVGSYYQNPTGVTLAESRRSAVLEIIERWSRAGRIFILEDAAYRELCYGTITPRSIRSYDRTGETVILTQTFSKSFSPGLKTGYSLLPSALVKPVLQQKGNHDFGSANFIQHVLAAVVRSGRYAEHVARLRSVYRAKLVVILESLDSEFSRCQIDGQWTRPDGGLYVWLTLPSDIDTTATGGLFQRCLERGVLYVPGEYCFPPSGSIAAGAPLGGPQHTMRLSFGVQSADRLREGVARLAQAVADCRGSRPIES